MGSSIVEIVLYALGGCILGAVCGWLAQARTSNRHRIAANNVAQTKIDEITDQRNRFANEGLKARETIQTLQATVAQRNTELGKRASEITKRNTEFASVLEKSKLLAKNVLTLRTERENTKIQINTILKALESLKGQTAALQTEFEKAREFYKRELLKSFEKRKLLEKEAELLEKDMMESQSEQHAISKRVKSAPVAHGFTDDVVAEANARLGQLEVLERNVNKLEAENVDLNSDILRLKQEVEARDRDLVDLEELRINNKQLVRCVEGLEGSRKAHESDAERYREKADQSEKVSDTLRFRLDDLQKNFAEIEEQQGKALTSARRASVVPLLRNKG
jgi:chromosome segregation ATPase